MDPLFQPLNPEFLPTDSVDNFVDEISESLINPRKSWTGNGMAIFWTKIFLYNFQLVSFSYLKNQRFRAQSKTRS
jgi:hypothetical protein